MDSYYINTNEILHVKITCSLRLVKNTELQWLQNIWGLFQSALVVEKMLWYFICAYTYNNHTWRCEISLLLLKIFQRTGVEDKISYLRVAITVYSLQEWCVNVFARFSLAREKDYKCRKKRNKSVKDSTVTLLGQKESQMFLVTSPFNSFEHS